MKSATLPPLKLVVAGVAIPLTNFRSYNLTTAARLNGSPCIKQIKAREQLVEENKVFLGAHVPRELSLLDLNPSSDDSDNAHIETRAPGDFERTPGSYKSGSTTINWSSDTHCNDDVFANTVSAQAPILPFRISIPDHPSYSWVTFVSNFSILQSVTTDCQPLNVAGMSYNITWKDPNIQAIEFFSQLGCHDHILTKTPDDHKFCGSIDTTKKSPYMSFRGSLRHGNYDGYEKKRRTKAIRTDGTALDHLESREKNSDSDISGSVLHERGSKAKPSSNGTIKAWSNRTTCNKTGGGENRYSYVSLQRLILFS